VKTGFAVRQKMMRSKSVFAMTMLGFALFTSSFHKVWADEGEEEDEKPEKPRMSPELLKRAKADPCALLVAALRPLEGQARSFPGLREKNGDLIVGVVLHDGANEFDVLKRGKRCTGGYVGVDKRPGKKDRWIHYLEVAFEENECGTLDFVGWQISYEIDPNGEILSSIGQLCGADTEGKVRLDNHQRWRRVGPQDTGCSD